MFTATKSSKRKGSFWKKIDEIMLNINFIRFKDSCIEEKIYYQRIVYQQFCGIEHYIKNKQWLWVEINS